MEWNENGELELTVLSQKAWKLIENGKTHSIMVIHVDSVSENNVTHRGIANRPIFCTDITKSRGQSQKSEIHR